jgi:predicted nucleotidyltransferase
MKAAVLAFVWRCCRRAAEETKWFTYRDVIPSVVMGAVTALATIRVTQHDGHFKASPIVVPIVSGLVAFIGILIVINVIEFARTAFLAAGRLRGDDESQRQGTLLSDSVKSNMRSWIRSALADPKFGVELVAVFGSVIKDYNAWDIDVIVQLLPAEKGRLRQSAIEIQSLNEAFHETYGKMLHFTFFADHERNQLLQFTKVAEGIQILIGKERWEGLSDQNT